jgi:hypothetical protein
MLKLPFFPECGHQCLLGIISAKVVKYANQKKNGRLVWSPNGCVDYFVSDAKIAKFLPKDLKF